MGAAVAQHSGKRTNQPTRVRACAPVPAIDVAIIGPQKAPLLGTHARSDPRIGIPSGSETRSKRPGKLRQRNQSRDRNPTLHSAQLSSTASTTFSLSASGT